VVTIPARQRRYLEAMGVVLWESRTGAARQPEAEALREGAAEAGPAQLDWEALQQAVAHCTRCQLHKHRTRTVFGVGDQQARWMIVGEAPGADEDRQGEPFVGRAGQLLNEMLRAIGLRREAVYIANILKCRPPRNRDPLPEEVACCKPYLRRQIALLQPAMILAVGRVAAQNLLDKDLSLGAMRGREFSFEDSGIPVVVSYHPAYLLRSPREKAKVWDDLKRARAIYEARQDCS